MQSPFWNPGEARLRSGWRIALFFALIFLVNQGAHGVSAQSLGLWVARASEHFAALRMAYFWLGSGIVVLLVLVVASEYVDRRSLADFGFRLDRCWWRDFGLGAAISLTVIGLIFAIEWAAGLVHVSATLDAGSAPSLGLALAASLATFVGVAVVGDVLFCAYPARNLMEGLRAILGPQRAMLLAILTPAFFFTVVQSLTPGIPPLGLLSAAIFGLLAGAIYLLNGQLGLLLGLDIGWSFAEASLFGFPVSGGGPEVLDGGLIRITQSGPDWLTGGGFGPEAGAVGFAVLMVVVLLFAAHYRRHLAVLTDGRSAPISRL
jgi:hypothetical protein